MSVRAIAPLVTVLVLAVADLAAAAPRSRHTRVETPKGPVHVWTPARYDVETAGVVVYVHGYFTHVDRAWHQHRLARQFAASGVNAMFIVCGAPAAPGEPVVWPSLEELLGTVADRLEQELPAGRIVAVGHSGAHRTLTAWLDEPRLHTLALVDAYYGDMPGLVDWLAESDERRLIDIGALTRRWTDELHAMIPDTLVFERFPSRHTGRLAGARDARVVYVRTRLDHMWLVTGGVVLPMILRTLRIPAVSRRS